MDVESAKLEVDDNFTYFKSQVSKLKENHSKEFALLHKKAIIEFFESENDAIKIGIKNYGEGCFSVQQVAGDSIGLGFQSYVII
jgi:hypothetical protein